jgi:putative nucleotidyltransferase with HDIG domain
MTARAAYPPFEGSSSGLRGTAAGRRDGAPVRLGVEPIQWFAAGLAAAVAGLCVALVAVGSSIAAPLWMVGALAAVALAAEKQSVRVGSHTEVSVSGLPILFAAVIAGPLAGIAVGAAALLGEWRRPYTRWVVWTASRSLAGGLAGVAASLVLARSGDEPRFGLLLAAVGFAALVEAVSDGTLVALTAKVRHNNTFRRELRTMMRIALGTVPLHIPVVSALVYLYDAVSVWTVVLFLVPTLASQRLLMLYREQRQLADDLAGANERLKRASLSFASALVAALDARDQYTAGHSAAVAVYARDIAVELGLPRKDQELAHLAGLLHDVGKVGLPAGILEKDGPLTPSERRLMQEHSVIGERILANVEGYEEIASIVRHHHERMDGRGYPDELVGSEIPLLSRILAVADAYNAMTSKRPYRDALSPEAARALIRADAFVQFDGAVVDAFDRLLTNSDVAYLVGDHRSFTSEAQRHPALRAALVAAAA